MAKEVTIKGLKFTIVDCLTGRTWQEIQKLTQALQEKRMDNVSYTNATIKLLVTSMSYEDNGETVTVNNVEDVLNRILDADVEVIDTISTEVADVISNNPYIKKKMQS